MTMSRQLINLAGGLAAVVILALGILLVALPMFGEAGATQQQADETAQTNDVYQIQVETLRGQQAELPDLERELAALRAQIPDTAHNDEVLELIGDAVATSGVSPETITAGDPETWTPPSVVADQDTATEEATAPPAADTAADAATDTAEGGTDETSDGATSDDTTAGAEPTELEPQQVVTFTITVSTASAAQAMSFIDGLRDGDRLLSIEHAVLTEEEDGLTLTVNARSLILLQK